MDLIGNSYFVFLSVNHNALKLYSEVTNFNPKIKIMILKKII